MTPVAKVGRNSPCPCGSGEKYKRCHGNLAAPQPAASPRIEDSGLSPEAIAKIKAQHRRVQERIEWPARFGHIAPIEGRRIVGIGPNLYRSGGYLVACDSIRSLTNIAWA